VKLTNRANLSIGGGSHISLASMHKYQPVIILQKVESDRSIVLCTFEPPEARFIAVTAYQSGDVIKLKVKHNPFAKGFREGSNRKRSLSISPMSSSSESQQQMQFAAQLSRAGIDVKRSRKLPFDISAPIPPYTFGCLYPSSVYGSPFAGGPFPFSLTTPFLTAPPHHFPIGQKPPAPQNLEQFYNNFNNNNKQTNEGGGNNSSTITAAEADPDGDLVNKPGAGEESSLATTKTAAAASTSLMLTPYSYLNLNQLGYFLNPQLCKPQ